MRSRGLPTLLLLKPTMLLLQVRVPIFSSSATELTTTRRRHTVPTLPSAGQFFPPLEGDDDASSCCLWRYTVRTPDEGKICLARVSLGALGSSRSGSKSIAR
jgi:hypothetical protein